MNLHVINFTPFGHPTDQPARTINWSSGDPWPPLCAWCRKQAIQVQNHIIWPGITIDLVLTTGYCPTCELGTNAWREVAHGSLDYKKGGKRK